MYKYALYLPGLCLVAFGLLVLIEPRILVAIVAATLILAGFSLLGIAHKIASSSERTIITTKWWFSDDE